MTRNSAVVTVLQRGASLAFTVGFLLAGHNLLFNGNHSWWLVGGLTTGGLFVGGVASGGRGRPAPSSAGDIERGFADARVEKLRSVLLAFPRAWQYRKAGVGTHMFMAEDGGFVIAIELTYLNHTEINTLDGYKAYAVEFARDRKSRLLFNEIRQRWGMDVHEFGDESATTAGHRVTVPYHGTEYGFQLRLNDPALAPAARLWFEAFLAHVRFETPLLVPQRAFGGRLSISLPPEFRAEASADESVAVWRSASRRDCTVRVLMQGRQRGTSLDGLLRTLAESSPAPDRARRETDKLHPISLRENGFGGYVYYGAEGAWGWFGAVGDLPTGGRYAFCLDDRDPRQEPFEAVYHYVQIAYEMVVSMREASGRAATPMAATPAATSPISLEIRRARSQGILALNLDARGLENLPDEIWTLVTLRELYLRKNMLRELPDEIGLLENLEVLNVSGNRLSSLPEGLTRLKKVRILGISTNELRELPAAIGDMSGLEELHAGGNLLTSLPPSMGRLQRLAKLNACNNRLVAVPRELADARALRYLYLHDNPGLELSDEELGPTWVDVRGGQSPADPKQIMRIWLSRQL